NEAHNDCQRIHSLSFVCRANDSLLSMSRTDRREYIPLVDSKDRERYNYPTKGFPLRIMISFYLSCSHVATGLKVTTLGNSMIGIVVMKLGGTCMKKALC